MPDQIPDDAFWNLVAAYIDAGRREELWQSSAPALRESVVRHVQGCEACQARLRAVRGERNAGGKQEEGA